MNKIKGFTKKHPIWSFGVIFGVLSLICNLIWFGFAGSTHAYDIIHAIPVIFIYTPIIELMGGGMQSSIIYLPLLVIMDALIGMIVGAISYKINKSGQQQGLIVGLSFAVYWILVTFQWLPII